MQELIIQNKITTVRKFFSLYLINEIKTEKYTEYESVYKMHI